MPTEVLAYLPGVVLLLFLSGFFSGSEAAFFSLTLTQRRALAKGNPASKVAHALVVRSERLLMGILFWNLAINISYFSLISKIALAVEAEGEHGSLAAGITLGALIAIIVLGEFVPKSLAVLYPIPIAAFVAFPLALMIRLIDIFLPTVRFLNEASRRLLWPGLRPEPYLDMADLNRAVELSAEDATLVELESQVLQNIIQLKEIRVEEWMRPRTQYVAFTPPVSLEQLVERKPPSGYMLVTDSEGREIVSAIDLRNLLPQDSDSLSKHQVPLVVIPWCATIADALQRLRDLDRRVAVIVNEYGESVGILTWEEIFDAILQVQNAKSHREFARSEIRQVAADVWLVTGMTKIRRLERALGRRIGDGYNLTIGGIVQEHLHRIPEVGDQCDFDGLQLVVKEAGLRGELLVEVSWKKQLTEGEAT